MKPACSWCKDYTKYYENVQLRILIQNYKKLCGLIKITRLWSNLVKQGDQGSDIMDIVRESEGEKLKNLRNHKFGLRNDNLMKQEEVEPMDEVRDDPETGDVEPPDEIISSPASKLNIYTNNPDISKVDNIKVTTIDSDQSLHFHLLSGEAVGGTDSAITRSVSTSLFSNISLTLIQSNENKKN